MFIWTLKTGYRNTMDTCHKIFFIQIKLPRWWRQNKAQFISCLYPGPLGALTSNLSMYSKHWLSVIFFVRVNVVLPLLSLTSTAAPLSSSNLIMSTLPTRAAWWRAAILQRKKNKLWIQILSMSIIQQFALLRSSILVVTSKYWSDVGTLINGNIAQTLTLSSMGIFRCII